jgi:shikimate dehydrogenase
MNDRHVDPISVSGRTGITALIGDPVQHVKSPLMANAAFHRRGLDVAMVVMHVKPNDLAGAICGLRAWQNFRGAIITMPHKAAIVPLLDDVGTEVREVGACNVIRREAGGRLVGTLLDGEGFVAGLANSGHRVADQRILLAGAGGAASAIAFSLARHGARRIAILNRTPAKAADLAKRVRASFPTCDCTATDDSAETYDIAVNATSVGMRPDDLLPFPDAVLRPPLLVADIVVSVERTRLIDAAERRGCAVHVGRHMIAAQIEWMLDFMLLNQG